MIYKTEVALCMQDAIVCHNMTKRDKVFVDILNHAPYNLYTTVEDAGFELCNQRQVPLK